MGGHIEIDGRELDPATLRVRQAQLLNDRARGSAVTVSALIILYSFALSFVTPLYLVGSWAFAALVMVGTTLLLPLLYKTSEIDQENATAYLRWHIFVSCCTGAIWGFGIAAVTDTSSAISVALTVAMVLGVTLGGVSPQSAYRPTYVGLASFMLLPYGAWILATADWPLNIFGAAVLCAYAFFMSLSARVDIGTREALAVQHNQVLLKQNADQHEALRRGTEEKIRLLAATSHDLKQPLHAQAFFVAALKQRLSSSEDLELLEKIDASLTAQENLLEGLSDVLAIDTGSIVADKRVVNVSGLVSSMADEFAELATKKGVVVDCALENASATTDPVLLTRIIRNLLSNAVKYSESGGRVSVNVFSKDEAIEISIQDEGPGIPTDRQEFVFQEYTQLDNPNRDREKGMGLGLSIVQRLSDILDIRVELSSGVEAGTCITLTLPGAEPALTEMVVSKPDNTGTRHGSVNDLVVFAAENDDTLLYAMAAALSEWGCRAMTAGRGEDVIRILDQLNVTPDVFVLSESYYAASGGLGTVQRIWEELNEQIPIFLIVNKPEQWLAEKASRDITLIQAPLEPEFLYQSLVGIANKGWR